MVVNIRERVHTEAKEAIRKLKNLIVEISMRVGKTKIACDIIMEDYSDVKVHIFVPFVDLIEKTWEAEFIKWYGKVPDNVKFSSFAAIKKLDYTPDYIIVDECQLLSEQQCKDLPLCNKLLMSGFLSTDTIKELKDRLSIKVGYKYTLTQAVKDGVIADFNINLVHCKLDYLDKYVDGGTKLKPFKTTEKDNYEYLTKTFNKFKVLSFNNPKFNNVKMLTSGKRMRFIYSCKSKIDAVKKYLDARLEEKILIFTGDTTTANLFSDNTHHSKSEESALDSFMVGECNHLAVVKMANVGITFCALDKIVIHQINSNAETASQIIARALNLDFFGKIANIWVFVIDNTVDENWCTKALDWVPTNKINHIDYRSLT